MKLSKCCNSKTYLHKKKGKEIRTCCECQKPCDTWNAGKIEDEVPETIVASGWHEPEVKIAKKNVRRLFIVSLFLALVFILLAFKGVIYYMKLPV